MLYPSQTVKGYDCYAEEFTLCLWGLWEPQRVL